MPLVALRQLLDEAAAGGYGVGAFNVNDMEQIQAIMEAARETESPVIVQASRGARSYTNDRFLIALMQAAVELYPEIPVVLHQDHGNSPAKIPFTPPPTTVNSPSGPISANLAKKISSNSMRHQTLAWAKGNYDFIMGRPGNRVKPATPQD